MSDAPSLTTTRRPVPEAPDEHGNYKGYKTSIWRKGWVQTIVPWTTSLAIHLGLVIFALVLVFSGALNVIIPSAAEEQPMIPTTDLSDGDLGGIPNPGSDLNPTEAATSLEPVAQSNNPAPVGPGEIGNALAESGTSASSSPTGLGGMADALSAGMAGGGQGSTIFGPGGGGNRPGIEFMGSIGGGGNTTRVVFLSDASGSMNGLKWVLLRDQLKKAIDPLKPNQEFNVIFFREAGIEAKNPSGLVPATTRFKRETFTWLENLNTAPNSNPIPALEAAFRMKPQLIFLLTDGQFSGPTSTVTDQQVIEKINQLNSDRTTMINTILFRGSGEDGPDAEAAERVLRQIASENQGVYKFVTPDDL